jgi:cation transport ATPase
MNAEPVLAASYNMLAIPVAAGALYPVFGLMLRPEFGALAMSASSINAVFERPRPDV